MSTGIPSRNYLLGSFHAPNKLQRTCSRSLQTRSRMTTWGARNSGTRPGKLLSPRPWFTNNAHVHHLFTRLKPDQANTQEKREEEEEKEKDPSLQLPAARYSGTRWSWWGRVSRVLALARVGPTACLGSWEDSAGDFRRAIGDV